MADIHITPKQLQIVLLLYRFRFLNRIHIQTLLNHKDPKRINTWLKDLTEKNIIGRHYSNTLKENTKPAIYYLATKAKQILLTQPDVNQKLLIRVYREKLRSPKLIDHCLFVADIYFLLNTRAADSGHTLHFYTKTDLVSHNYLPYTRPDAYIAIQSPEETKRYFLEIIDEGTPRFMLRSKIAQYLEYFDQQIWSTNTGHQNPALLIVCPNDPIKTFLQKHIAQVLEEEGTEILCFLSLRDTLRANGIQADTWEAVAA